MNLQLEINCHEIGPTWHLCYGPIEALLVRERSSGALWLEKPSLNNWSVFHLSASESFSRFLFHVLSREGLGGGIHTVPFDSGICRSNPTPL